MHDDPIAHGLPHREPFVFVDYVLAVCEQGAECTKRFTGDEDFFRGHFPENPIVPGVLLTEALAQTAGIAAGHAQRGGSFRLAAIKAMKFRRAVHPGENIVLLAQQMGRSDELLQFQVAATVDGETVADGVVVLSAV